MRFNQNKAEQLLKQVIQNPNGPTAGVVMNDLLAEFHRGYPLENLKLLLSNKDQDLVRVGAWIASELGSNGNSLLPDIIGLLSHPSYKVRFSAIDCILVWAGASDGGALALAAALIADPSPGVRWKAMDFLARASLEQLEAALSYLVLQAPQSEEIDRIRWLLSSVSRDAEAITNALQSRDGLVRKYAAIAAVRISRINSKPLLIAAVDEDPDVKDFAQSGIALLK